MRPTHLQFRSPKEKTAEYNIPVVTKEGGGLLSNTAQKNRPTFSKGRRFSLYDDLAKNTGYRVGPGSYSPVNKDIAVSHVSGGHKYKSFHAYKDVTNNGYLFVGDQMTFDNSLVLPSRRTKFRKVLTLTAVAPEYTTGGINRTSTASTPARARVSELSKQRYMSPHYKNSLF